MLSSSLNATRFAQKPLAQPGYSFADVPSARRDLRGSSLQYVDSREAFHSCMAEMLLLCKEATRRRRRQLEELERSRASAAASSGPGEASEGGAGPHAAAAKPLSLEYLADRIDVDDPIFGFVVRTAENERLVNNDGGGGAGSASAGARASLRTAAGSRGGSVEGAEPPSESEAKRPAVKGAGAAGDDRATGASSTDTKGGESQQAAAKNGGEESGADSWQRGMLQGFITCTTFTNYQKTFEWDSLNPVAFLFDGDHHHHHHDHQYHRPHEPPPSSSTSEPGDAASGAENGNGEKDGIPQGGGAAESALGRSAASSSSAPQQPPPPPASSPRARDEDGSLAAEMQATVRCGDIWNEGIVWPRIAEISLLGGLKCGRALVNLVVEHLEFMKASGRCNYDYVVLQATDNSISFYESMGFVRVGAVVKDEPNPTRRGGGGDSSSDSSSGDGAIAEAVPDDSPEKPNAVAQSLNFVCSPTVPFTVDKAGDTPADIARRTNVDVWDIVFLNLGLYPEICPRSRLLVGTVLQLPAPAVSKKDAASKARTGPQWYLAKENETPRMIARTFNVNCLELVEANRHRIDGLLSNSRLREGTRLQVSDFELAQDGEYKPYAHWSFPDDQFEEPEPSYMMARRLDRRKGSANKQRAFEASLAVPITQFEPPSLLLPLSPEPASATAASTPAPLQASARCASSGAPARHRDDPNAPVPPKRPPTSFLLFGNEMRVVHKANIDGLAAIEISRYVSNLWNQLSAAQKVKYEKKAEECKQAYFRDKAAYQDALESYMASSSAASIAESSEASAAVGAASTADPGCSRRSSTASTSGASLYNKVVKLKPGAMTEGSEYTYWYVLTFIPDLRWCHLAPMVPAGTFDKSKSQGRPKYKLVDESLGKEVDISSSFCIPIKSRAMKRTLDADKEEWDIIDDGTIDDSCDTSVKAFSRTEARGGAHPSLPIRFTSCDRLPRLTATWKRREVMVRITYDVDKMNAGKRKRPSTADSAASYSPSSHYSDDEPPAKRREQPPKSNLKPPPETYAVPLPSSPSTARSRSQPPSNSRTSPGRAAALLSLGHRQLLHSPLVRVRGSRPVVPDVVRFSQPPSMPEAPVARSSRGRSLTPSTRFSSTVRFTEAALMPKRRPLNRSRSVDVVRTAPRPMNASAVFRSPKLDIRWNNYAIKLKAYCQKHGSCRVPRAFPEDQSFANWVHNQRYSKTLTKERIDLLNELGFEWNAGSSSQGNDFTVSGWSTPASVVAESSDPRDPQAGAVELETETTAYPSRDKDVSSDAGGTSGRSTNRSSGRLKEPQEQPNASESILPPSSNSGGVEGRQFEPLDIRRPQSPMQEPPEVRGEADVPVGRSRRRPESSSLQPSTSEGPTSLSQLPSSKANTDIKEATSSSGPSNDVPKRVSSRTQGRSAESSSATVTHENEATQGRSRTRSAAATSAALQASPEQYLATSDGESESDTDYSTHSSSSGSGQRRQCNSPLVHRSIRRRQGRHVSQRNELPAPETRASREPSSPVPRKRLRSSAVDEEELEAEEYAPIPKSPRKNSTNHKGTTMARELLSLLPFDQARKRRQVNSAGSRRTVLQS